MCKIISNKKTSFFFLQKSIQKWQQQKISVVIVYIFLTAVASIVIRRQLLSLVILCFVLIISSIFLWNVPRIIFFYWQRESNKRSNLVQNFSGNFLQQKERSLMNKQDISKIGIQEPTLNEACEAKPYIENMCTVEFTDKIHLMKGKLSTDDQKRLAAHSAVDRYVQSGMTIGLGTGSTVKYVVEYLAFLLKTGKLDNVRCVVTSEATHQQASSLGIPLISLDDLLIDDTEFCSTTSTNQQKSSYHVEYRQKLNNCSAAQIRLDVAIDGADEVELETMFVIKGGGGALLREKLVAYAAKIFIVIVDETKVVPPGQLGLKCKIPVEINAHFYRYIVQSILSSFPFSDMGVSGTIRMKPSISESSATRNVTPYLTDNNNFIVDLKIPVLIENPVYFSQVLKSITGVVDHGIFFERKPDTCIVAYSDGHVDFFTATR